MCWGGSIGADVVEGVYERAHATGLPTVRLVCSCRRKKIGPDSGGDFFVGGEVGPTDHVPSPSALSRAPGVARTRREGGVGGLSNELKFQFFNIQHSA